MNRAGHGVEKSSVGVGRKVHGNIGAGSNRSDDFDVEHDLAVRTVRTACRRVLALIHRDCEHVGCAKLEAGEVRTQVGRTETASELDDGDALPVAAPGRKAIERCDLKRCVRHGWCCGSTSISASPAA